MKEKPVWWPYKARNLTFYGDYPAPLCKEIHDLLSDDHHREKFTDMVVKHKPRVTERLYGMRKRNLQMYLSFFGVVDKMYVSDMPIKYGLNRERIRQIISRMTRRLFHYVSAETDIKLSIGVRYDPAIH
jgi:hypothetical protein